MDRAAVGPEIPAGAVRLPFQRTPSMKFLRLIGGHVVAVLGQQQDERIAAAQPAIAAGDGRGLAVIGDVGF